MVDELMCSEGLESQCAAVTVGQRARGVPSRYRMICKVGEGTYGVVYKAQDTEDPAKSIVALKKIWLDDRDEGVPVTTLREVALLRNLNHINIVRMREFVAVPPRIYLVFEYLDHDLKACLDTKFRGGMPPPLVKSCLLQILRGLAFCHARQILHRDLKPQNVLIDNAGFVKLADFGLARASQPANKQLYTNEVVTLWYRAPELLLGAQNYLNVVDVWAAGCIFTELSCRAPLFPGDSEIDQLYQIFRQLGTPTEESCPGVSSLPDFQPVFPCWPSKPLRRPAPTFGDDALDLLAHMLEFDPHKRLRADAALQHPYFDDMRDLEHLPSLTSMLEQPPQQTMQPAAVPTPPTQPTQALSSQPLSSQAPSSQPSSQLSAQPPSQPPSQPASQEAAAAAAWAELSLPSAPADPPPMPPWPSSSTGRGEGAPCLADENGGGNASAPTRAASSASHAAQPTAQTASKRSRRR